MGRVETFRAERRRKRSFFLAVFLSLFFMVSGILLTDYSVNNLLKDENRVDILRMRLIGGTVLDIGFMDQDVFINISYVSHDLQKLRDMVNNILSSF